MYNKYNIVYVKFHILSVNGNGYLLFEECDDVFINGYSKNIKLKNLVNGKLKEIELTNYIEEKDYDIFKIVVLKY